MFMDLLGVEIPGLKHHASQASTAGAALTDRAVEGGLTSACITSDGMCFTL